MDAETEAELVRILHKDPSEITEYDAGFLRARASYIKDKHKEKFSNVFGKKTFKPTNPAPTVETYEETVAQSQKDNDPITDNGPTTSEEGDENETETTTTTEYTDADDEETGADDIS